ncbi:hypothetical protein GGQ73_001263 [Rhizobium skierniewicense]|uniref:Uncharacterized protein n=1 Tax=Rhizobium skierniewicense TaxID=984260 RepID=A0A7W6CB71_9HYPH|nr:hypothetical protein [Rhizobium skierniewicense]
MIDNRVFSSADCTVRSDEDPFERFTSLLEAVTGHLRP